MKQPLQASCFLLFISLYLYTNNIHGQTNLIPNYSFELGNVNNPPSTFNAGLVGLDDWKPFGTSDWVRENDIMPGFITPAAGSGSMYIGFGPCEGGQVELNNYSANGAKYLYMDVSLKYRMTVNLPSQNEINYYLFKNKKFEGDIPDCDNDDFINEGVSGKIIIEPNSADRWHNYSTNVARSWPLLNPNSNFEWFALKGPHQAGKLGSTLYNFVDDISVEFKDYCFHPCAPNKVVEVLGHWTESTLTEEIEHYEPNIADAVRNWGTPLEIAILNVKNANYVKLTVVNRWGGIVEKEWFDPRGLSNQYWNHNDIHPNNPNLKQFLQNRPDLFTIMWNGEFNGSRDGGYAYAMRIEVSNCSVNRTKVINFPFTLLGDELHPQPRYNTQKAYFAGCCNLGNKVYNSHFSVNHDRYSGNIVYSDNANYNSNESYMSEAGEYIEIHPNVEFVAKKLTNQNYLSFEINTYCKTPNSPTSDFNEKKENSKLEKSFPTKSRTSFFPNPASKTLNISGFKDLKGIYNLTGNIISNNLYEFIISDSELTKDVITLDISRFKPGIYLFKILDSENTIITEKIIIQ